MMFPEMRGCRSLFCLLLSIFAAGPAEGGGGLVEISGNAAEAGLPLKGAVAEHAVSIGVAALASDPDVFELELPGVAGLHAVRERSWSRTDGSIFWTGRIYPDPRTLDAPSGRLRLSLRRDRVSGWITTDGGRFEILPGAGGGHRLVTLSSGSADEVPPLPAPAPVSGKARWQLDDVALGKSAETGSRIDVLTLYPEELLALDPHVEDRVLAGFDDASLLLGSSAARIRFHPVYVGPLTGEQEPPATSPAQGDLAAGLEWLSGDGGLPSDVARLRHQFGADLVVLVFAGDRTSPCALANAGERRPYAVVAIDCPSDGFWIARALARVLGQDPDLASPAVGTWDRAPAFARLELATSDPNLTPFLATESYIRARSSRPEVALTGFAVDAEDGDLSESIRWYSRHDGFLGNGSSVRFRAFDLLTAEVRDREGQTHRVTLVVPATI